MMMKIKIEPSRDVHWNFCLFIFNLLLLQGLVNSVNTIDVNLNLTFSITTYRFLTNKMHRFMFYLPEMFNVHSTTNTSLDLFSQNIFATYCP